MWWLGVVLAVVVFGAVAIALLRWRIRNRRFYYRALAERRRERLDESIARIAHPGEAVAKHQMFQEELFLTVPDFLETDAFAKLQAEAVKELERGFRSYIPIHKKGRSLPYERLHEVAPHCLSLYHSQALRRWVSVVVGTDVAPALDHDQSACSILYYDQPGDHIGWHYDHNYYDGRQFTVLLCLENRDRLGEGLSASRLEYRSRSGQVRSLATQPNELVIFEGGKVCHRVTPTKEGELRIMLSMTFNTQRTIRPWREAARRIKDVAFHGLKALWD